MPEAQHAEKERLIREIMRNAGSCAELQATLQQDGDKQKQLREVEADTQRWVAVGQAAATKLLEVLKEKGMCDDVKHEGDLLTRMHIPHERLQWSKDDEAFF